MKPSIYDYRDNEIAAAEIIRKRNRSRLIEAIVFGPIIAGCVVALLFV